MYIGKIMRKTLLFIVLCAATLNVAVAKKKKDAKKEVPVVELKSSSDTISYVAGYANTQGLIPYLQNPMGVDTAYMADFIKGFKEARAKVGDPSYGAYIVGMQIAKMVEDRMIAGMGSELKDGPDSLVRDMFYDGFIAALEKDTTKFNMESAGKRFQDAMNAAKQAKMEKTRKAGEQFLEENKTKPGVQTTASGLQYKVITEGTGVKPAADQEVLVKYEGRLVDGTVFDSTAKRGDQPAKFPANQVIKGWTEALTMMPVGSKWELYIPQNLAYGERQAGQIPPYSALIFTVELVDVVAKEAPADAPKVEEKEKVVPATKLTPAKKPAVRRAKGARK